MLRHMIGFLVLNDLNDEQLTLRVRTENNELEKKAIEDFRVNKIIDDKSYFFIRKHDFSLNHTKYK